MCYFCSPPRFLFLAMLAGIVILPSRSTWGESFLYGSAVGGNEGVISAQLDRSSTLLNEGAFAMALQAHPAGAQLDDRDSQGLGIDTSALAGVTDNQSTSGTTKLNLIDGSNSLSGQPESLSFSFDRPGILKSLFFDGVKDETLEYFLLVFPDGSEITLFDSQTDFRLGVQGYQLADLNVPNPVEFQKEDDDLTEIDYVFKAGETFTLTYGEADYSEVPDYSTNPQFPNFPNAVGNGARFQGVVVESIPEPTTAVLLLLVAVLLGIRR